MPGVRIVNKSRIHLPPGAIIPLSFFDVRWIHLKPVQDLLLYPHALLSTSFLHSFKSSLARTLPYFRPLAGTLTYLPTSGQLAIDCSSPDGGVTIIEAESDLDVCSLTENDTCDVESFLKLVPHIGAEKLPAPVFAVQITAIAGGGVAVGTALHHSAMDGLGFWRFMEVWSATCRGDGKGGLLGLETLHDRSVMIRHPMKNLISKRFVRELAPALPQLPQGPNPSLQDRLRLARRTFTVNSAAVQSLKQRALHQSQRSIAPPSTFVAFAAHFWISFLKAKGLSDDDGPTSLWLLVDLRSYLAPPGNTDFYTGNCIRGIQVKSTGSDLAAPDGLARACSAITKAVQVAREEPLRGIEKWSEEFKARPVGKSVLVAGSARWGAYEIDFGWGKPGRVELVSMNCDGEVSMFAGREKGTVQATVGLAAEYMEAFADAFLAGLELDSGRARL